MRASGVVWAATSRSSSLLSKADYRAIGTALASRAAQSFFNTPWRIDRDGQGNCSSSGRGVRRGGGRLVGAIEWNGRVGHQLEQRVDEHAELKHRFEHEHAEL